MEYLPYSNSGYYLARHMALGNHYELKTKNEAMLSGVIPKDSLKEIEVSATRDVKGVMDDAFFVEKIKQSARPLAPENVLNMSTAKGSGSSLFGGVVGIMVTRSASITWLREYTEEAVGMEGGVIVVRDEDSSYFFNKI